MGPVPTTRSRLAGCLTAALVAATTLSACQGDQRPAPQAEAPEKAPASASPVTTARALAALAIEAGVPGQVRSIRGDGDEQGAFAVVELAGGTGTRRVYLQAIAAAIAAGEALEGFETMPLGFGVTGD